MSRIAFAVKRQASSLKGTEGQFLGGIMGYFLMSGAAKKIFNPKVPYNGSQYLLTAHERPITHVYHD